jgi:putative nucleotidyltransferase with HDIG domain
MKRILFVDDEKLILDGIRRALHAERSRWEMRFAGGAEAAMQALNAESFDVVVSDMRMPGIDGVTLLTYVREHFPSTARLVLSGYSESASTALAIPVAHQMLNKPCNGDDVRAAIERVCTLQDVLGTPELQKVVGTIGTLPSLSKTYQALAQAVQNPSTSLEQVAEIVERDIAMSAKILQLVNSAFFGLPQRVTEIQNAVAYLGMDTIKNLALASDTFRVFAPDPRFPPSLYETMQQHAYRTATIVKALGLDRKDCEVAAVSALLHDIGKLILASKMPDQFRDVLTLTEKSGCSQCEAEEELLGISHAEIGAYLLGLWGINRVVVESIAHHHRPTRIPHSGFDVSAAVYVANLLAHELDVHPNDILGEELADLDRGYLETLRILEIFPVFREAARQCLDVPSK